MPLTFAPYISTIMHADKIVTMQDGRIVEVGSHSELLAKHGLYYHLYKAQFEHAFSQDNPFGEDTGRKADGNKSPADRTLAIK